MNLLENNLFEKRAAACSYLKAILATIFSQESKTQMTNIQK